MTKIIQITLHLKVAYEFFLLVNGEKNSKITVETVSLQVV